MSSWRTRRAALICFLVVAIVSVLVATGVTDALDRRTLQAIVPLRTPAATTFMRGASWIGDWMGEVPLFLLIVGLLWLRGHRRTFWRYVGLAACAELSWSAMKLLFRRPRPALADRLGEAGWYSYPSGHATLAPVIWGIGLVLLAQLFDSRAAKITLWTLSIAVPVAILVSRLYLAVHYPTDVLAGLALGMGWVLLWLRAGLVPGDVR
jgi:undecaprenyl-diphosphatase